MGLFFTVLVLGFVIFIHEMGHFLSALWMKVRVYEFCIGFGPKIFSINRLNIDYSFRLFPLGGFVRLAGMDDTEGQICSEEENFNSKSVFARMLIILAGSAVNILFGFLFFVAVSFFVGIPSLTPVITSVVEGRAADIAGMKVGDKLLSIDSKKINNVSDDFVKYVASSQGKSLKIVYLRQNQKYSVNVKPDVLKNENVPRIGIVLDSKITKWSIIFSIKYGIKQLTYYSLMVFKSFTYLFEGKASIKDLAGPVGIVQMAAFQYEQGILVFLHFMAMLSISLGVINLFPIPALDGGHFMFLVYELIFSKKVPENFKANIQAVGMFILLFLMSFIIVNDVLNWTDRSALFESLK